MNRFKNVIGNFSFADRRFVPCTSPEVSNTHVFSTIFKRMDKKRSNIDFSDVQVWYSEHLKKLKHEAMILEKKRRHAELCRKRHQALIRRERKLQKEKLRKPHAMIRRSQVAKLVKREGIPEQVTSAVRFHMSSVHGVSKCETCGAIKENKYFSLGHTRANGIRSLSRNCIKCGAMAGYDADPLVWFSKYIVSESRHRALSSGNVFTIDWKWVHDRFNELDGKCELCNRKMTTFKKDYRGNEEAKRFMSNPMNISLDQRVPGAGYTPENVQLVNLQCNLAKLDSSQEGFVEMCKAVAEKFSST